MALSLDSILPPEKAPGFKSQGERRIAEFLDQCGVRYMYEAPVAVQSREKLRLLYPDFKLPELGVHIEYFGIQGDPTYDRTIYDKMAAYAVSGITIIPVYPCHLPHLPQYLTRELREQAHYQCHVADTIPFRVQRCCSSSRDYRI